MIMRSQTVVFLAALLLYGNGAAFASSHSNAYLRDGNGNPVGSADGLCWRAGYWSPRDAITGCDGELAPPIGKPAAPDFLPTPRGTSAVSPLASPATKRCDFHIALLGNTNFGSGQDHLSGQGKKRLAAEFRQKVSACALIESITVNAHTDRMGKSIDNQRLSERRAAFLLAVLTSEGVTAPIEIQGFGSTHPMTRCEGRLRKSALIRCLAPDRRATIDVRGIAK